MKTTFDLPDSLLRAAKSMAAREGRPLRDLVAEALKEKLAGATRQPSRARGGSAEWEAFRAKLVRQSDGSYVNPDGIDDDEFFAAVESARRAGAPWQPRDPFADET